MKLMLTSAGISNKLLGDVLKKLVGKNMKIAFIPTASNLEEGDKKWVENDINNFRNLGDVSIVDISKLKKNVWLKKLEWANVIVVGGGDTAYLMKWVVKSGLNSELPELLKSRVYVGISAGSVILSRAIQTKAEYFFKLYDDEVKNPPKGLGLIDFDIRPHLNSPYFPRVNEKNFAQIFKNLKADLYAIDDSSAVVFNDGKIEVVSEGKWIKYSKN